jgi:hypothetical protein
MVGLDPTISGPWGTGFNAQAPYAIPQMHLVKIDQQPKPDAAEPKIGQQLRVVNGIKLGDGFQFDDDLLFHHQIDPVFAVDVLAFVTDRERLLAYAADPRAG